MVEIRQITRAELLEFRTAISFGFGGDLPDSERTDTEDDQFAARLPLETCLAGFDHRGRIVATLASIDFDLTVPAGTVPGSTVAGSTVPGSTVPGSTVPGSTVAMAGTTAVTVHPTHRRQGILTRMMAFHLNQVVERGQPLAGLWASEETIYGRFGYGHASPRIDLSVPASSVSFPDGPHDVSLRLVTTAEAADLLPPIYEQVRGTVAGLLSRTPAWWHGRHLRDPEYRRDGASAVRVVVADRAGSDVGYLTYRLREGGHGPVPSGTVEIEELVAVDDDARRSLWHFAANIDLHPNLSWWNCPVDEPVLHEIDRIRRATVRVDQSLWLRLLNVPAVLEARRYAYDDDPVIIEVADRAGLATGTYRLEVSDGQGRCAPTTSSPDVTLDVATLGALYLGGVPALGLARAGRIAGTATAVARLGRLMSTAAAPHCIEVF